MHLKTIEMLTQNHNGTKAFEFNITAYMYYLKGIVSTTVVRNLVPPQLQDNFHHDPLDIRRSLHCSPSSPSLTHCHHLTQARPIWSHLPSLRP